MIERKIRQPSFASEAADSHVIHVVKATDAEKFFQTAPPKEVKQLQPTPRLGPAQVRMMESTSAYTDLEISCACGQRTIVRCWHADSQTSLEQGS